MSFYRSEDMEYYRLIMPRQSAWDTVNLLGKHGLVHIVPNKSLIAERPFISQVKLCDDGLLKIKNLEKFMVEHKLGYPREFISQEELADLSKMWEIHEKSGGVESSRLNEVDEEVNNIWAYQEKLLAQKADIKQKLLLYRENIAIIQAGRKQYGDAFFEIKSKFYENPQHTSLFGLSDLQVKAIVVDNQKNLNSVKRTINRISRGNSLTNDVHYKDLFDKLYPGQQNKSVLFIIYPAKKGSILDTKVIKVIQNYCPHWSNYSLPQTDTNFVAKSENITKLYHQSQKMFQLTKQEDKVFLRNLMGKVEGKNITQIQYYKYYLMKQREVYSQLNQMTTHLNFVEGEAYMRKHDVEEVQQILYKVGSETKTPIATLVQEDNTKLPTYFQLNDYKMPAQQIINTYGIPRYQQANPSFFTTVTFPFLFGVMFGDIAHGFIAFLFGVFLMFQNRNSQNSVIRALYPYRYLIALMGFFATYCGFIYNDFLSISLNLFGSCFDIKSGHPTENQTSGGTLYKTSADCVYPFGVDPAWGVASNNLNYINSLKMKISVIIAVVHMTLGVFIKATNAIYFRSKLEFVFQFLPQLVFMVALFGYMDFLIVYKWLKPWKLYDSAAPSIITTMINLPLKVGKTDKCCGGQPMWGQYGKTSQDFIQFILLVIGVICIPLMLLPKPIIEICQGKKHNKIKKSPPVYPAPIAPVAPVAPVNASVAAQSNVSALVPVSANVPAAVAAGNNIDHPQSPVNGPQSPDRMLPAPVQQNIQHQVNNEIIKPQQPQKVKGTETGQHMDSGQIFVHQLIETIEYVLGCISNTASYLRLWALSLAHSQLSEVFLQKTIQSGIIKGKAGIPILILAFPILAGATFGVLLCMDSMECFLHTLRLHWVQFQNKFYKGDGFIFNPINFTNKIRDTVAKQG